MAELDSAVYTQIQEHCTKGDLLAEKNQFTNAIEEYNKAWKLVPEPKNNWEASTWILTAIGDSGFLGGFHNTARDALRYAMTCPDGLGNPFLHLRLGQVLYEQGDKDEAADELMRAYMGAGSEIFEKEDAKYLKFLKTRAKIAD